MGSLEEQIDDAEVTACLQNLDLVDASGGPSGWERTAPGSVPNPICLHSKKKKTAYSDMHFVGNSKSY